MYENTYPSKRYRETLKFLMESVPPPAKVLDLGVKNPFSGIMSENGYEVHNTGGEDLDEQTSAVKTRDYEVVTAFEIFEHLLAPYNILKEI
ncbi:MAG: methyltransferase, partial [Salegentibacter sp.]